MMEKRKAGSLLPAAAVSGSVSSQRDSKRTVRVSVPSRGFGVESPGLNRHLVSSVAPMVSAAWKDLSHDCSVDYDGQNKPLALSRQLGGRDDPCPQHRALDLNSYSPGPHRCLLLTWRREAQTSKRCSFITMQ